MKAAKSYYRCYCKTQFCYECSERWKHCECPQFEDDRLLAEEERVANRRGAVGEAERDEVRREILERHECGHQLGFDRVEGSNTCDECNQLLREYLMQCRGCHILVCRRCQTHRL